MSLKHYGTEWRACRKLEHIALSPSAVKQYFPMQEQFAALLATEILDSPESFYDLTRLLVTIISVAPLFTNVIF